MASVTFEHVYKRFGDVVAVNDLNIYVEDKEFLVFVGPSGCGKTTSLRLLAGLEEISEGNILIGDRVVNDVPPKDRDIAMVFQSYALYPHMSVYDNMAFGLKLRKTPKADIDRRVKEAADILDIGHLLDRKPKQLSGGQRQRVAVGRAIVREPAVFLFDEPLSNLDAKLRVQTRAQLTRLHQRLATTFIYVTHDQVEAMTMASRIAVMKDGLLQQIDTPAAPLRPPGQRVRRRLHRQPQHELLRRHPGRERRQAGDQQRRLPPGSARRQGRRVAPVQRQQVIFGIRPEDIHAKPFVPPSILEADMVARVDVTELMGNEIFLYLMTRTTSSSLPVSTRAFAPRPATSWIWPSTWRTPTSSTRRPRSASPASRIAW